MMNVTRVDILVVLAAIGVVVFVALLPSPRDNNPTVPDTAEHRGLRSERDCLRCHAAGASQAVPARHPSRTDCFRCHRDSVGRMPDQPPGAGIDQEDRLLLTGQTVVRRGVNGKSARDGTHAAATRR